jgi:type I restriction enzyme M protein
MTTINRGIKEGLISFNDDRTSITYLHQNKNRNYGKGYPEEEVQAETFLQLVLTYNYPVERIKQFVTVQIGSKPMQADIEGCFY